MYAPPTYGKIYMNKARPQISLTRVLCYVLTYNLRYTIADTDPVHYYVEKGGMIGTCTFELCTHYNSIGEAAVPPC